MSKELDYKKSMEIVGVTMQLYAANMLGKSCELSHKEVAVLVEYITHLVKCSDRSSAQITRIEVKE